MGRHALVARQVAVIGAIALLLAACATQPPASVAASAPGFWYGLLHGVISPFALIASIFSDVRVYAFPNSGLGYDAGFVLGMICLMGAASR
jgi:hypothetical protein